MKKSLLVWGVLLWSGGFSPLFSRADEGDCRLLNWDVVVGGSAIYQDLGQCKYEIDVTELEGGSYIQGGLSESSFGAGQEHWVQFEFSGIGFDRSKPGHFRIMTLQANESLDTLVAIDVFWDHSNERNPPIYLQGFLLETNPRNPSQVRLNSMTPEPITITSVAQDWVLVELKFTESSGPGLFDGFLELWVDGDLVGTKLDQDFSWPSQRSPDAIRYGVIQEFDPETSGKLYFAPIRPSPWNPDF